MENIAKIIAWNRMITKIEEDIAEFPSDPAVQQALDEIMEILHEVENEMEGHYFYAEVEYDANGVEIVNITAWKVSPELDKIYVEEYNSLPTDEKPFIFGGKAVDSLVKAFADVKTWADESA